jgi:hypothetical protein
MHRQLKRDAAHIASTSGSPPSAGTYCPLDLYSGYEPRMRRAINELWLGWCEDLEGKSNSLRLFLNGKVVRSGDVRLPAPLICCAHARPADWSSIVRKRRYPDWHVR